MKRQESVMRYSFVLSLGLMCGSILVSGEQPTSVAPAVDAAKEREQAVRTVAIEFRVVEEVAEGAVTEDLPGALNVKKLKIPTKATTLESTNRLVFAANKTRYECNHPLWATDTGELKQRRVVNTTDGKFEKSFFAIDSTKADKPEGIIGRDAQSNDIRSALLVPLTVWYRGTQNSISPYPLASYRPTGAVANIGGIECQEYAQGNNRSDVTFFWFDPSSGNALRRIRTDRKGKAQNQYDIAYRLSETGVWVPVSWVRNTFSLGGRVLTTERVEVISTRLNAEYPDSDFDVTFPPGTRLYNARESKFYMVQDDGTLRGYSLETGELAPEAVYQPGTPWFERNQFWVVGASLACVVSLALVLIWRRRRA